LGNIRKLLRKGGAIILNEATEKRGWIDITFGMTEGWWRFEDHIVRKDYPLLSQEKWSDLLHLTGFENISHFTATDNVNKIHSGQNVIIAVRNREVDSLKRHVNIVISDSALSSDDSEKISQLHGELVTVTDNSDYIAISENEFQVPLDSVDEVMKFFDEEIVIGAGSLSVLFIARRDASMNKVNVCDDALRYCTQLLNIAKCLKDLKIRAELKIVTVNALGVNSNDKLDGFASSSLWGFGKVLDLEHPELKVKLADSDDLTDIASIASEVLHGDGEKLTAFRKGHKYKARIAAARFSQKHNFNPKKNFAYLITGGFSGIGLLSAGMLADLGARNIILAGRRGTSDEAEALKKELAQRRVKVLFVKADVTKEEGINDIFDIAEEQGLKIKGIIHSAGLLDDAVVMNQTAEKFRNVLEPKVKAALLLHEKTKKRGLQFFIMYSSIASVLGSAGQANHSAANAFLDSFSKYLHSNGHRATSINWGVWSGIGSAVERGADKQEKIPGVQTISPAEGIRALKKVFDSDIPQLGIYKIDWNKYNSSTDNPLSAEMKGDELHEDDSGTKKVVKESLAEKLSHSDEHDQTSLLQNYFRNLISSIMGLEPEDIEPDIPLSSMGLDSLMAIELKNKVNMELGVNLNLVRYMEETDINQLSSELKEQIPEMLSKAGKAPMQASTEELTPTESEKARELLADLDNLSEEELDKLLKEMN
jgi:NAD(P)-dependent dehydrogenase (short-subunit alcohol dehydrogenase family)/acyl carrier protein